MKSLFLNTRTAFLLLAILATTMLINCGSDDPSEAERVKKLLTSGSWKPESVTVDGVNKNDVYEGLSLTFTAAGFTSTGGEPVWPSSGTWVFGDASAKFFTRNDDVIVFVEAISETSLTLSLTWTKTTLGSGREQSVEGDHVFVLTKN